MGPLYLMFVFLGVVPLLTLCTCIILENTWKPIKWPYFSYNLSDEKAFFPWKLFWHAKSNGEFEFD